MINLIDHKLAKQRSIAVYESQLDRIDELENKYGVKLMLSELVRQGLATVLDQIEEQLKETKGEK